MVKSLYRSYQQDISGFGSRVSLFMTSSFNTRGAVFQGPLCSWKVTVLKIFTWLKFLLLHCHQWQRFCNGCAVPRSSENPWPLIFFQWLLFSAIALSDFGALLKAPCYRQRIAQFSKFDLGKYRKKHRTKTAFKLLRLRLWLDSCIRIKNNCRMLWYWEKISGRYVIFEKAVLLNVSSHLQL